MLLAQDATRVPEAGPLDWTHLDRATLGDRRLAHEVLGLFLDQVAGFPDELAMPANGRTLAIHRLKGAARAIGAWPIAEAALAVERCLGAQADPAKALAALDARIAETRVAIAAHLRLDAAGAGAAQTDSL